MRFLFGVALGLTLCASSAYAFWDVQQSGKDVFGNINVTASSVGDNGNLLRFECGSSGEPFVAFLLRDDSGGIEDYPAKFIHVGPVNDRYESEAVLTAWNENYVAIKVSDKEMLRRIAEHMVVAKNSISVGVAVPIGGFKQADTFSSRGSTAAGKVVLKNCILPRSEETKSLAGDTENVDGNRNAVQYHYGFVSGVWNICKKEELGGNSGHILNLISTAIQSDSLMNAGHQSRSDRMLGENDATDFVAKAGCGDAALAAIERLPAKF